MMFRGIYESGEDRGQAQEQLQEWSTKLEPDIEILPSFKAPRQTMKPMRRQS